MNKTMVAVRAEQGELAVEIEDNMNEILANLQQRIGSQKFNAWFKRGTRLSLEDGIAQVAVPNQFVGNWIESHYLTDISAAVEEVRGISHPVRVALDHTLSGTLRKGQLDNQAQMVDMAGQGRTRPRPVTQVLRYKLDDFVVGECNRLAYSAALAIVGGEKAPFNPLFVHGSCGVGKTHLLQGICNLAGKARRFGKELAWRYITGEQFTNEFVNALRAKKVEEFRSRYRKLDLLAIDDVHFLANKKATQDEFLHTFNAIESAGRQVVMASDAHPRLVGELNEQLVSRFLAGMVVKINTPDLATRMEIVQRRTAAMKLSLDQPVLEYVATHVHGSVREVEGALLKLSAVSALNNGPVTQQMAAEALADHLARTDSAVTLGAIETAAAAYFGITVADIHSSRRTKTVSAARMICMFLARRHTRMSYPEIGKCMGKNHSSVVLAVQKMEQLLAANHNVEWMTPMGTKCLPAATLTQLLAEQITGR